MSAFDGIRGHARAKRVLATALASGRVPHAYLFWGIEGIGKEKTARAMARVLLCSSPGAMADAEPCGTCASCRKVEAGSHPDLYLLAPGEKAISVEEVRRLQQNLSFQAYEKGRKVVIIRDSFNMSREGANALLKTVEEPPRDTFLFLLATHRSRLLPTLVSRAQAVRFDPLPSEDVRRILEDGGIPPGEAEGLAAMSGGSPGAALEMDRAELPALVAEVERIAVGLGEMGMSERFALSERWSKDKSGLETKLLLLERALSRNALTLPGASDRYDRLNLVRGLLTRNVNPQLALDALFVLDAGRRLEDMN